MHSIHRTLFDPGRFCPPAAAFLLLVASAVLAPAALARAPEVTFDAPEVDEGNVIIDYSFNRKPQQILDQTCELDPLGFTPCPEGSEQEPKATAYTFTQEGLTAGEYTYNVFFTLTDGGITSASVPFTVEGCLATNATQMTPGSASLGAVINAAAPGDTIEVRGVCVGNFTIDKSLTLQGMGASPTLFGGEFDGAGAVLHVSEVSASVVINDLLITNGNGPSGGDLWVRCVTTDYPCAAGIMSVGSLTLNGSIVSGNLATSILMNGGIAAYGTLILNTSWVSGNQATLGAGGIYFGFGTAVLSDSTVSDNIVVGSGGGGICNCAIDAFFPPTLILNHSTVSGNVTLGDGLSGGSGGGIANIGNAFLNDSTVTGNTAFNKGGGIWTLSGVLFLNDSTVTENTAADEGGGIWTRSNETTLKGSSSVTDNMASEGGGIFVSNFLNSTILNACNSTGVDEWTGALSPNDPEDPPTPTLISCN